MSAQNSNPVSASRRFRLALLACAFAAVGTAQTVAEESWTRFRGPNGSGVIGQSSVTLPWTDANVRWKVDLKGVGNSSPVIWQDQIFTLSADPEDGTRQLASIDLRSGKQLWNKDFPSETHPLHQRSSYASATPCVDKDAVYVAWGVPSSVIVKAFTHDGQELWSRDLGRYVSQHGFGTSPIRVGDLLILVNSQDAQELPEGVAPGESSIIALDYKSGATVWETDRLSTRVNYGVPCVYKDAKGNDIILGAGTTEGFFAVNAKNGEQLWTKPNFDKRVVSSAVVVGDLLLSSCGSGGGGNQLVALRIEGDHEVAFTVNRAAPYVPTPVAKDQWIFMWADNGIVSCVDKNDGKVIWQERIGGNVSSSPVIIGDKLLGIAEDGTVTILSASGQYRVLGEVKLGETTRSTPAATADALLIRTERSLICVQ